MISSSGACAARPRMRSAASVLAAVGLLFSIGVAGCAPEPTEQGAPTTSTQYPSSPTDTVTPSYAEDDEKIDDGGAAPGEPDGGSAPDAAGPVEGDGGSGGDGQSHSDPAPNGTDDWREPDDPTAEGPTAAPALPEVNGQVGEVVTLPTEVVVSIASISTTTLTAETPGEYSGSAIVVDVQVTNESDVPQPVGSATVSLSAEDGDIGVPTWAYPNDPLQGEVPTGATAAGTYVFMLDPADERSVTVRVNYSAGEPVATFTGATP